MPPVTLTVPVLLNTPLGLIVATVAVDLLRVPVLLKTWPLPVLLASGLVLVPARFQVPALVTTALPWKNRPPAPVVLTVPVLFQVLLPNRLPPMVVVPLVVNTPVPESVPAEPVNVVTAMSPLPLKAPPFTVSDATVDAPFAVKVPPETRICPLELVAPFTVRLPEVMLTISEESRLATAGKAEFTCTVGVPVGRSMIASWVEVGTTPRVHLVVSLHKPPELVFHSLIAV